MKRLEQIGDARQMQGIARLVSHDDFKYLKAFLHQSNQHINGRLRGRCDDSENHRDQGAGQAVDDLLELFDKADEWAEKMAIQAASRRPG